MRCNFGCLERVLIVLRGLLQFVKMELLSSEYELAVYSLVQYRLVQEMTWLHCCSQLEQWCGHLTARTGRSHIIFKPLWSTNSSLKKSGRIGSQIWTLQLACGEMVYPGFWLATGKRLKFTRPENMESSKYIAKNCGSSRNEREWYKWHLLLSFAHYLLKVVDNKAGASSLGNLQVMDDCVLPVMSLVVVAPNGAVRHLCAHSRLQCYLAVCLSS